jgi:hypothetical protein
MTSPSRFEKLLRIGSLTVACISAAVYVFCVNASSTKGYVLHGAQVDTAALQLENARLHAEITRLRSLSSVSVRQQFTQLVPAEHVEYVRVTGENMAYR